MSPANDRGTAGTLGESDLPAGYKLEGQNVLITPSGLRIEAQTPSSGSNRAAINISNKSGNTVHFDYGEWEFAAQRFVMPVMANAGVQSSSSSGT